MKIYRHEFLYNFYEDHGSFAVYMTKPMEEDDFFELFNRKYAGKNISDVKDVVTDMWMERIPRFRRIAEDESDGPYRYDTDDVFDETYRFMRTEINVMEGTDVE